MNFTAQKGFSTLLIIIPIIVLAIIFLIFFSGVIKTNPDGLLADPPLNEEVKTAEDIIKNDKPFDPAESIP